MSDVVLVHGTTQNARGFTRLASALEERGHRALCVDVPSGAAGSSVEYADLLAAQLPPLRAPVVLAHSASGLLLPALTARLRARHQVWHAAAVADHRRGRSFLEEIRADADAVLQPDWQGIDPTGDPVLAAHFLFHDTDLAGLREGLDTLAPCDLSAVHAERPAHDPAAVPSTYLLPEADRALQPRWMARVARQRLHVEPTAVAGGHNCHIAHPDQIAAVIDDVQGRV